MFFLCAASRITGAGPRPLGAAAAGHSTLPARRPRCAAVGLRGSPASICSIIGADGCQACDRAAAFRPGRWPMKIRYIPLVHTRFAAYSPMAVHFVSLAGRSLPGAMNAEVCPSRQGGSARPGMPGALVLPRPQGTALRAFFLPASFLAKEHAVTTQQEQDPVPSPCLLYTSPSPRD